MPIKRASAYARLQGELRHLLPLLESLPDDFSENEVQRVIDLISKNSDVFRKHKFDLGCTDLIQVRIPTGDAKPYAEGLRSHPRAYLDAIDREIDLMVASDIIEPSRSSWNSSIVCVKKKNGDLRMR